MRRDASLLNIWLVRHGQSTWNATGMMQGQAVRVPLTQLGRQQADRLARLLAIELAGARADGLVTSDLLRAVQTARPIAGALGTEAQVDRRWREQSYGAFEGQPSREVLALLRRGGATRLRTAGGETLDAVYRRVGAALSEWVAVDADRPRRLVVVTHGDTIRAAVAWLYRRSSAQIDPEVPPNASVASITLLHGRIVEHRTVTTGVGDRDHLG